MLSVSNLSHDIARQPHQARGHRIWPALVNGSEALLTDASTNLAAPTCVTSDRDLLSFVSRRFHHRTTDRTDVSRLMNGCRSGKAGACKLHRRGPLCTNRLGSVSKNGDITFQFVARCIGECSKKDWTRKTNQLINCFRISSRS
jgi:hypothetical protein